MVAPKDLGFTEEITPSYTSVGIFPFKVPGADTPSAEMKSTGEVMGIGDGFVAFAKSQIAAGNKLPQRAWYS